MIPKLENSYQAIDAGVKQVIITKADAIRPGQGTCVQQLNTKYKLSTDFTMLDKGVVTTLQLLFFLSFPQHFQP